MSTNQAFIKAYRRDGAQIASPVHVEQARRASASPVSVSPSGPVAASSLQFGATIAFVSPGAGIEYTAAPDAGPPATHNREANRISDVFPLAEPRATERTIGPRVDRTRDTVKRPLSSFMHRAAAPPPAAGARFQPGATIAAYQWPRHCRQLLARHKSAFDGVTETLLAEADAGRSTIGVLGCFRGVGCTTTVLCLAARAARRKRRIIAVDGHFQSPQIAASLSVMPNAWWQDVLEGSAELSDAAIHAEDDAFDVLVLDPDSPSAARERAQHAHSSQFARAARDLRAAYEMVLVDLGAFFDPHSQPLALDLVRDLRIDAVVAVTDSKRHDSRDIDTIARRLDQQRCKLLGTVLNRVVDDNELELERHVS